MIHNENRTRLIELLPGLLVTLIIAGLAFLTWLLLKGTFLKFSALLWSFVFSIVIINIKPSFFEGKCRLGIELSATRLLRGSIAALGLTVNATVWLNVGGIGISMVLQVCSKIKRSINFINCGRHRYLWSISYSRSWTCNSR